MNSKRIYWLLLAASALCLIGLIGGAFVINSQLEKQSTHLAELKQQNEALTQQQIGLIKAKKEITAYQDLKKITKAIVPQDKDQAAAVREIVNIAQSTGITLSAINFPASTLGNGITKSGTTSTTTPSPSSAKSSLSQLQPVKGMTGVYSLQIVLQNSQDSLVTYNQLYSFLTKLENNRRTAQVSSLAIQPSANNRNMLSFTITLNEYIKPS